MLEPKDLPIGEIDVGLLIRACTMCSLLKGAVVFKGPLILVMPVLGLHVDLVQLEMMQHHTSRQWKHQSHLFFFILDLNS